MTLAFELHVPEGLRRDIRGKRLDQAVAAITGAVHAVAPRVFPWGDRIVVRTSCDYRWWEDKETIQLAASQNTVTRPMTAEEGASLVAAESAAG